MLGLMNGSHSSWFHTTNKSRRPRTDLCCESRSAAAVQVTDPPAQPASAPSRNTPSYEASRPSPALPLRTHRFLQTRSNPWLAGSVPVQGGPVGGGEATASCRAHSRWTPTPARRGRTAYTVTTRNSCLRWIVGGINTRSAFSCGCSASNCADASTSPGARRSRTCGLSPGPRTVTDSCK